MYISLFVHSHSTCHSGYNSIYSTSGEVWEYPCATMIWLLHGAATGEEHTTQQRYSVRRESKRAKKTKVNLSISSWVSSLNSSKDWTLPDCLFATFCAEREIFHSFKPITIYRHQHPIMINLFDAIDDKIIYFLLLWQKVPMWCLMLCFTFALLAEL